MDPLIRDSDIYNIPTEGNYDTTTALNKYLNAMIELKNIKNKQLNIVIKLKQELEKL